MEKIIIIGLGAGDLEQLPMNIYRQLMSTSIPVYVRTKKHPAVQSLMNQGVPLSSFDHFYEESSCFEEVYERITQALLKEAKEKEIIYAVPGHPMVAERTVQLLLAQKEISINIAGGQSFLDDLFTALKIDPVEGFQLIDATSFMRENIQYRNHVIFTQVYHSFIASEIKLALLEDLPYDYEVYLVDAAGSTNEKVTKVNLEDLDRTDEFTNLTSVYIPPVKDDMLNHQFQRLRKIIQILRSPEGCEWDRAQTHESLKRYTLEEAYELLAAIDQKNDDAIVEELGDLLLQVMLHSQIGEERGFFTIDDVIKGLVKKMLRRHPHVFGEEQVTSIEEIEALWEREKQKERKKQYESRLSTVKDSLPSLSKAYDLQKEAAKVGFDWSEAEPIWDKLVEEIQEVREAIHTKDADAIEEEFGDVLFVLANLTRFYKIHPEVALHRTNEKFKRRFQYIERRFQETRRPIEEAHLEEMNKYWEEAKERGE